LTSYFVPAPLSSGLMHQPLDIKRDEDLSKSYR